VLLLWSGPRNVSTALMYAFAQRPDTAVVDEPLYAHYLQRSGAQHPGRDAVLAAQDHDGDRVVRDEILAPCRRPVRFVKSMAHHLSGLDPAFLDRVDSVLLTRDPREMLPSLSVQIPEPTLADTGLEQQVALLERELAQGREPRVLDARELLLDPEGVVRELCRGLDLPFEAGMFAWPAGPRPEDGVWARHWYAHVHRSTGFAPYRPKGEPFPERLEPLLEACLPLYDALAQHAIRARPT
jgi:hypothetical protein